MRDYLSRFLYTIDHLWKSYVSGDPVAEEMLGAHAHNRRLALERGDPAAAAAAPMHR